MIDQCGRSYCYQYAPLAGEQCLTIIATLNDVNRNSDRAIPSAPGHTSLHMSAFIHTMIACNSPPIRMLFCWQGLF